jgi:CRISPR-associated endonuclease/helicase Cas3
MKLARPGQSLIKHLTGVGEKTALRMPAAWRKIGMYAGLWHDLGKILQAWQDYLNNGGGRVPHSPHGAMLARSLSSRPPAAYVPSLTFVIAGHHGGLRDKSHLQGDHLIEIAKGWETARDEAIQEIPNFLPEKLPEFNLRGTRLEFATRMLFGCLVDADRIDAAMAIAQQNAPSQANEASVLATLSTCFNPRHTDGALSPLRSEFASDCMVKAGQPCGLFRLTGPTGVGKTIASLKFAIAHCQANLHTPDQDGLEGILYVGPLQSIIEQNWQVYTKVLKTPVLAHYSDFQPSQEELSTYKLTTERWDTPVICTSGVQFYESLFARTPAKCRKLSHLMRRCILIDEAQSIPLEYAKPILDVLKALVEDWGCSVILMSATQPSFRNIDPDFDNRCVDIITDTRSQFFFAETRRTNYQVSQDPWQWQHIAERIRSVKLPALFPYQSLTVVNTTQLARDGFIALSENMGGSWFHLSARMVPAHRKKVLAEINRRTSPRNPAKKSLCHVISTQVVEAGVDLDFPLVLRQFAPLDSIIQAAGRCNREGDLDWRDAIVQIFDLEDARYPSADYRKRTQITREILASGDYDLNDSLQLLKAIETYYRKCNSELAGDIHDIQELRRNFQFEKVANLVKLIDDEHQISVVVPWGEGADLLQSLDLSKALDEEEWRKLQPYTLNLPESQFQDIVEPATKSGVIVFPKGFYSEEFGASRIFSEVI